MHYSFCGPAADIEHWLKQFNPLVRGAPPKIHDIAQWAFDAISNRLAECVTELEQMRAEQLNAPSDDDSDHADSDVEEDGQFGGGGDHDAEDSGDTQGQPLPARRRVSPPPEHRGHRVASPPTGFLQNRGEFRLFDV